MNKTIWIYWHQGWENAPDICKKCLNTWRVHNPNWKIEELCWKNIKNYIDLEQTVPNLNNSNIPLAALSDIIRIALLRKFGGLWVDSTLFCTRPLDSWSKEIFIHDFFAFSLPAPDRLISSWFLYAQKGSYLIEQWYKLVVDYWSKRNSPFQYFWFHYCFNDLYQTDDLFSDIWDNTPKFSADGPHYFVPHNRKLFEIADNKKIEEIRAQFNTPVFKLTYKFDKQRDQTNTVLEYLSNLL